MTYIPEPYTIKYYKSINKDEVYQANALGIAIKEIYKPNSIVDIGCGTGLYLNKFKDIEHFGIDISEAVMDSSVNRIKKENFKLDDITSPNFKFNRKFDIALCLEVLEHIGMEHMEQTIKNVTSASDTIIASAAQVGQAGLNHITLQPYSYWEDLFNRNGFERAYHDEYPLLIPISKVHHTIWIIRNLMVFKRKI